MNLPPGQRAVEGFPRFGTHLHRSPPTVPVDPAVEIDGAVADPLSLPLADLTTLPRREITVDFHCVAGWSAIGLRWAGVGFDTLWRKVIEPSAHPDVMVSHIAVSGLDGYRSVLSIDDAMAEDVLIADHLDGQPLDGDHGAPARVVSPSQYGYMSTKHLCRIELHTTEPTEIHAAHPIAGAGLGSPLARTHPRARVWEEERTRNLPNWLVRPLYRPFIRPITYLSTPRDRRD